VLRLRYGNGLQAMSSVGGQNLRMRRWVRESEVSLSQVEQPWHITPLSQAPSTAPRFVSKGVHTIAVLQSDGQMFFIYLFVHRSV